jgi:amino acid transporter
MTTSSRMIYAFGRDGGLPASPFFSKVHRKLGVPLNALYLTTVLVIIFGLIFLGSSRYEPAALSSEQLLTILVHSMLLFPSPSLLSICPTAYRSSSTSSRAAR